MTRTRLVEVLLAAMLGGLLPAAAGAADDAHSFEVRLRGVYFGDEGRPYPSATAPNPAAVRYDQGALGLEVNYKSPFWGGVIGVDASGYGVLKVHDSGTPTTQLVEVQNDGQLQHGYLAPGQALVKLKWDEFALVKGGLQAHDSLFLRTTANRAVPDTYSGVTVALTPLQGLKAYGSVINRFRSRSTGELEKFRTEAPVNNGIDYVGIVGASYVSGPVALTAEYLRSKSYLSKFGLVGAYTVPIRGTALKLSSGMFTSRDAGSLFVCGAEREMDCTGTSRASNKGIGGYVDADWRISNFTFGLAVAKFGEFWIEDNFAVNALRTGALTQDPGTNPFPTSAMLGPDFTNNDEFVASVRVAYDWKEHVRGLKTAFKYNRGTGAHSSNLANSAEGKESYREFDLRYDLPFMKNLAIRYVYLNYHSRITDGTTSATIRGFPRQDWEQHRFYVDYAYQF